MSECSSLKVNAVSVFYSPRPWSSHQITSSFFLYHCRCAGNPSVAASTVVITACSPVPADRKNTAFLSAGRRRPDLHNSLIMSRFKYQYGAPSRLTEGRGNETLCSGAKQHRGGTKRQLLPCLEVTTYQAKAGPGPELRLKSGES